METDSRHSRSEISAPHKTQPSSPPTSKFRGSAPDRFPSFLYPLRDENPLAGSSRSAQLFTIFCFSESKQNSPVTKRMIPFVRPKYSTMRRIEAQESTASNQASSALVP